MRRLLAVSLLFLLVGCAAPGVQMSGGNVSFDLKPVPGEGFVLLRMQSARPSGIFNPKWQTIRVMREGGGRVGRVLEELLGHQ